MKKLVSVLIVFIALFLAIREGAFAYSKASASSAKLTPISSELIPDNRAFVSSADKYNLDWRLVVSISGLESGFGIHIPENSYNGWGWGIYGNNVLYFKSWEDGIETISKGLRERYLFDRPDSDPYIIGPTYASSPTWAQRVSFFMESIELFRMNQAKNSLVLSI